MTVSITRTVHCKKCQDEKRPQLGQMFFTKGTRGKFIVHEVENKIKVKDYGFTPHLILFVKAKGKEVMCRKICLMNGCGVIDRQIGNGKYELHYTEVTDLVLRLEDWNTLVLHSDYGYRLD
jgi:hypothetical protein